MELPRPSVLHKQTSQIKTNELPRKFLVGMLVADNEFEMGNAMIRKALIATYIMLVLAVSAVARAAFISTPVCNPINCKNKHLVGPVVKPPSIKDPLPGSVGTGHNSMIHFVNGNIEITSESL